MPPSLIEGQSPICGRQGLGGDTSAAIVSHTVEDDTVAVQQSYKANAAQIVLPQIPIFRQM